MTNLADLIELECVFYIWRHHFNVGDCKEWRETFISIALREGLDNFPTEII